jgi:hypothetical protein
MALNYYLKVEFSIKNGMVWNHSVTTGLDHKNHPVTLRCLNSSQIHFNCFSNRTMIHCCPHFLIHAPPLSVRYVVHTQKSNGPNIVVKIEIPEGLSVVVRGKLWT